MRNMRNHNKKKKPNSLETVSLKQAHHRNCSEDDHLALVMKVLSMEQKRRIHAIDKEQAAELRFFLNLQKTQPVKGEVLDSFHTSERQRLLEVVIHIVDCYMAKQLRDKEQYFKQQTEKTKIQKNEPNKPTKPKSKQKSIIKPVPSAMHLEFIQRAFPEITEQPREFRTSTDRLIDIYHHSRASHNLKCFSTPNKSVGGYTTRGPINFRIWKGGDQPNVEPEPERVRLPPLKLPPIDLSHIINWND